MSKELSASQRAYIASTVRSAIDLVFAHWEGALDLDLDTQYRELLDSTIGTGDRGQFSREMSAFMAALNNGHTRYHDIEGWSPLSGSLGFHAAPTGSDWMITRSWAQGLRAGEVVERINGEAPGDAYDQQERCISASNERGRRRNFFRCPHLFALKILLRVDGRNVRFRRVPGKREPPMERTAGHWLQHGKVGYVRIPSFGDPKHEARALELVKDFHEASAILVDVRGNTGGSTPERLIEALMDRPSRGWTESTPQRVGVVRAYAHLFEMLGTPQGKDLHLTPERLARLQVLRSWDRAHVLFPAPLEQPKPGAYRGKVVLLTDETCVSACEDFLQPFKTSGRGTLVGTTTAGSTGQPYILGLPEGIRVDVGAKRCYFPDGSPFEGIGLAPDQEVRTSREDLLRGRDPVLEAAKEIATLRG